MTGEVFVWEMYLYCVFVKRLVGPPMTHQQTERQSVFGV